MSSRLSRREQLFSDETKVSSRPSPVISEAGPPEPPRNAAHHHCKSEGFLQGECRHTGWRALDFKLSPSEMQSAPQALCPGISLAVPELGACVQVCTAEIRIFNSSYFWDQILLPDSL